MLRMSLAGGPSSRGRAVRAKAKLLLANAYARVLTTAVLCKTSEAPLAIAMASGFCDILLLRGATKVSREKPMVLSARAAAPTFPGWLGATIIKWMWLCSLAGTGVFGNVIYNSVFIIKA